jgi:hypothetical protein
MSESENYDLFIKLDADMVFRTPDELEKVVDLFSNKPDLDHAIVAVKDWYSDLLIQGLHIFSNRCVWEVNEDDRFVDHNPVCPGNLMEFWDNPSPLVNHSPNPADKQAFRFGIHRALKVVQRKKRIIIFNQSKTQWHYLQKCWQKFKKTNDKRLGFALIGAVMTLEGKINSHVYDYDQSKIIHHLIKYKEYDNKAIYNLLEPTFSNSYYRSKKFVRSIGLLRLFASYFYQKSKDVYRLIKYN